MALVLYESLMLLTTFSAYLAAVVFNLLSSQSRRTLVQIESELTIKKLPVYKAKITTKSPSKATKKSESHE